MSRIMIVDDDFDILRYCDTILAGNGHEVVIVSEPEKALNILQGHSVDLLIVDVVMPQITGFDFIKQVKKLKHIHAPILMLTGRSAAKDVKTALDLGATDYMVKPLDRDVFLAKISFILDRRGPSHETVQFAEGSTNARAEMTFPALILGASEMGLTMRTMSYVDRNTRLKLASSIFQDIGITCPPLRAVACRPLEDDKEFHYEVFVSFIGLDEFVMKKIRRWIASSAIMKRKAS